MSPKLQLLSFFITGFEARSDRLALISPWSWVLLRIALFNLMGTMAIEAAGSVQEAKGQAARGRQFLAFNAFDSFTPTPGSNLDQIVFVSPLISSAISFNEAIVSWNADLPQGASLSVEVRAEYSGKRTKFYNLGLWSLNPAHHPRQSVAGQADADGDVSTDTLVLRRPANQLQLRLTTAGVSSLDLPLKFLGISLTDTNVSPEPLVPMREAWGIIIPVPERSQMVYPGGKALCSPTTVSMLMGYWSQTLNLPELDRPVPAIADAIYDSQWQGTGNWSFNMAYAGSFPGMRAYVTRLSDISELETWIAHKIPIGLSVDYDRLRAKGPGPNGHLVALVGFTKTGDPIINDPGTSEHVRKVFARQNLVEAWACSHNTVYLIYPQSTTSPEDPFEHWAPSFRK